MLDEKIENVLITLDRIQQDITIPRNIREKIRTATTFLKEDNLDIAIKIDKSLQELDDLSEDPNVPAYAKTEIWNVVSLLESI